MRTASILSACLLSAMLVFGARKVSAAPVLSLDIDLASAPQTMPGFTSFPVTFASQLNPSVSVGAITATLNGNWGARDRGSSNPADSGAFTENLLLRDTVFPFDPGNGPFTMTISGLTPNSAFDTSVWMYDGATGSAVTWDVSANGVLVANDYGLTIPPTNNDQNRVDFQATSDGTGVVVISLSDYQPAVPPNGFAEYRFNAIQMTQVPEPMNIVMIVIGFAAIGATRLRRKQGGCEAAH